MFTYCGHLAWRSANFFSFSSDFWESLSRGEDFPGPVLKLFPGLLLHNHFRPALVDPTDGYLKSVENPCSEDEDDSRSPSSS
jgi:hypothetical protein